MSLSPRYFAYLVETRVKSHIDAYYTEVREQIELYRKFPRQIPDFYKGKRRVSAILGYDGIAVAHYFAGEDSFTFTTEDKPSADIMERIAGMAVRGNGPLNGLTWYCDEHRSRIALKSMGERDNLAIAEWSSDLSPRRWSQEAGRQQAKAEISSRVTAKLLGLLTAEPRTVQDTLEERIAAFRELLDSNPREERVQVFLEQNLALLDPMAGKISPKVKLGGQYVTDFVIERPEEEYTLVEIEPPHYKLFTKSGELTREVNHAFRQVTDWNEWIKENLDSVRKNTPALSKVDYPRCRVIIGRRPESEHDRKRLRQFNWQHPTITIQSYDDLLLQAEQHLQNLRAYQPGT